MVAANNCATGTLNVYTPNLDKPWNLQRAQHLFRRIGFDTNLTTLQDALEDNPADIVDQVINTSIIQLITTPPEWADWNIGDYYNYETGDLDFGLLYGHLAEWKLTWANEMLNSTKAFREKMALFWSNHFVTEFESYQCTPAMYRYHKLLQQHAVGNFKDFVYDIGLTPAMLFYLNGDTNTAEDSNENYARELLELFTLGRDNGYNQSDIDNISRALTGWSSNDCVEVEFNEADFDNTSKTFFGQSGNFNYNDVINILFEERADLIAHYICGRIYREFVCDDLNDEIIAGLAQTFRDNDWEIAPVLRQLFKSEHFFDEGFYGVKIKSPIQTVTSFVKQLDLVSYLNDDSIAYLGELAAYLGQNLFDPPNVAGWPGNRAWIDNNTLTTRWQVTNFLGLTAFEEEPEILRQLAKDLTGNSTDPIIVTQAIVDYFLPNGLQTPEAYATATDVFKGDVPDNYFENGWWNLDFEYAPGMVALLIVHLGRQPEFQTY